mmetsp:Transcript_11257/g.16426  ORF Transcript_11257/g.16426 Transcript_11257/m.16426 type:complete len:106 (+) Transcript_11257:168-485(+)
MHVPSFKSQNRLAAGLKRLSLFTVRYNGCKICVVLHSLLLSVTSSFSTVSMLRNVISLVLKPADKGYYTLNYFTQVIPVLLLHSTTTLMTTIGVMLANRSPFVRV